MDHVAWAQQPDLRRPVMVVAFEGWNDAGDAATMAARYLRDLWDARHVASIDPESFYDFSSTRPSVRLVDGGQREVLWPTNDVSAALVRDGERDVVFLLGVEPQLRWRTFCEEIVGIARGLGVELVIALGALLADVAHTQPAHVMGSSSDPGMREAFGVSTSRYEGPTGIVGVLQEALSSTGFPCVSLWSAVPAYLPAVPSPKAALALVERVTELIGASVPTTGLEIATASYEREMDAAVASDEDLSAYLSRLQELDDDEDDDEDDEEPDEVPTSGNLVEEVERFLRNQGPD